MEAKQEVGFGEITIGDTDRTIDNRGGVYLDGTLVLLSGGIIQRDPSDPADLHMASVGPEERVRDLGPSGPAWEAGELYTSPVFRAKKDFAQAITQWTGEESGWAILSAEHGVVEPWQTVTPYQTSIEDIGGDETNPQHRVKNKFRRRRPDGREIVTELDQWAAKAAYGLMRWVAGHRNNGDLPGDSRANTLLIIAEEEYIAPLRERGVFEYGISRMAGNPNEGFEQPLTPRFLFDNIDAETAGEQMAWFSDALSRFEGAVDAGEQVEVSQWGGEKRACELCGANGAGSQLKEIDGEVTCPDCRPSSCARCGKMTHETGMGNYPLCLECQTDYGGQKSEPCSPEMTEQAELTHND